jgi:hypothetical protein
MRTSTEHLGSVRRRVASGQYRVSSNRVASAMLEKIGARALDRELNLAGRRIQMPADASHRQV